MKFKIYILAFIFFLTGYGDCFGQTAYYVDAVAGNDANPGTLAAPWKNLSKLYALILTPGSSINLKAGSVWNGQQLKFGGSGAPGNPITVNSYGTGNKPLLNGNGITGEAVVYLYNQQQIEISNLEITNDPVIPWADNHFFVGINNGTTNNNPNGADRRGVMVAVDGYGTASHIWLKNLDVHHVKGQLGSGQTLVNGALPKRTGGIYFAVLDQLENASSKSRFDDVLVDGCTVYYCENIGLAFDNEWNVYYPGGENSALAADRAEFAEWYNRRFSNVKVSNNVLHHIGKNAMIIRCTDETGLIEKNVCFETALGTTGNTMFTARAKGTVFQYNEGYLNRSTTQTIDPGNYDGSMYDPDYGSVGIIFQYSYSHDNSSGIYWGCNTRSLTTNASGIPDPGDVGCTLRYCISQNDRGSLVFFNYPSAGNEIYNNVFYIRSGVNPNIIQENGSSNHTYNYHNNIIYNMSTGADYAFAGTGVQTRSFLNNNFYYNRPASEPADPFKITDNPFFLNPGSGGNGLNSLNGYKLQLGSPALNSGRLIAGNGGLDYYGNSVSSTMAPNRGAYNGPGVKSTAPIVVFVDSFTAPNFTLATNANPPLPTSGYYSNLPLTGYASASDSANMLRIANGSVAGLGYVTASDSNFLAPFNPVLAGNIDSVYWSFNMWTKRSGSSAINSSMGGTYGVATILACDNPNPRAAGAKGYGIFMLQSPWTNTRFRFHLIYFTNGIDGVANSGSVNQTIIDTSVSISIGAKFYSLRVSYDPQTDKWQTAWRDDGALAFADPASNATAYTYGTPKSLNTAGTAIALKYFGFAYKYSTTLNNNALFDQFKVEIVPQLQTLSASPSSLSFGTLLSGTQSGSQSFNLSGSQLSGFPGTVTITAPSSDFQVSNNNSTWGSSTTVSFSSGTLTATPIYVRFTPQSAATFSLNVKAIGGGADTLYIPVTGTGVAPGIIGDPIYNPSPIFTFLAGQPVTIPFTTYGTINAGNVYTAQLSNAAGSFASPVTIGTLSSSATGALTMSGIIPANTPGGTGYLIRVLASAPVYTGTPNSNPLTVIAPQTLPYAQDFGSLNAPLGTFTTYPAGWQGWKFNNNNIGSTASTDPPLNERPIKGGDASIVSDSAYSYAINGKMGFGTASTQNGIVLAINTLGYTNIGLSFDAMTMWNPMTSLDSVIAGMVLQYRVGGTGSFTAIPSYSLKEYRNITTAQTSGTTGQNIIANLNVTLPSACDNQPLVEIRWALRRVSLLSGGSIKTTTCPTFAIDNVYLGLSTQPTFSSAYLQGDTVNISFTAAGIFNAGNQFTVQLSDASGSFTAPVNIGSVTSNSSGAQVINVTIPANTVGGTGYRIRVVSSSPAINGSDNFINLAIVSPQTLPYAQDFSSLTGATTIFPAGWVGTVVSANPPSSAGRTSPASGYKTMVGGDASGSTNGFYDYNGKLGFLSSKSADNALQLSLNTLGYSGGIGVSFDAMTIRNPFVGSPSADSIRQALVLQYRVGSSGNFTTLPYLMSEYINNTTQQITAGTTTPQNRVNGLFATLPAACDNKPLVQLRWIFRTSSGSTSSTATCQWPSFAVDNIYVGISTRPLTDTAFAPGTSFTVPFNASGVYAAGNVFTVQLSNATGSFASPVSIGTLSSSSSGVQTINATIPGSQPVGGGYRIRVVSSSPYIIGTETGRDLIVFTPFYYGGSGPLDNLLSWWSNPAGTGSNPSNFTGNYQHFRIMNTTAVSTTAPWTVSGTGSRIYVGDASLPGIALTVASGAPITIATPAEGIYLPQASSGSNLVNLQDPTTPGFGIMHASSEVRYRAGIITGTTKTFGKITIENSSTVTFSGTPIVQTSLTVAAGATLNTTNAGTFCKMNILSGASVAINGTVNVQNSAGLSCVSCDNTTGAVFNFADASPNLTLGPSSTIQYAKTSTQTVQPYAYANLDITGNSGNVKTIQSSGGSSSSASVTGALTVTGATLNTSNLLTLKSTATNTARIGVSTGTISGNVTIERYVAASRTWRLLTAPILPNSTQTLSQAWQEGARSITGVQNPNPNPGYGTHITGPLPSASNGFDESPLNNYSIKYHDGSTWVGTGIAPLSTPIASRLGWMLFIRGDRSINIGSSASNTTSTPTTLRCNGSVYSGTTQPPVFNTASGWNVVGNPYPSAIDFSSVTKTGPGDIYYLWEPKLGTTGGWVTLTRSAGTTYTANPVLPMGSNINLSTGRIESGAAFMVNAANISSLQFKETDKSTLNALVFRPDSASAAPVPSLRTELYVRAADGSQKLYDGVLQLFDSTYNNEVDGADALKFSNFNEGLSLIENGKALSVEKRRMFSGSDTVFFQLTRMATRSYRILLSPEGMRRENLAAELHDRFAGTIVPLPMDGTTPIDFIPDPAAPASYAADRFYLVFKKAVAFLGFSAQASGLQVRLQWQVAAENGLLPYQIERSVDGSNFEPIGEQLPENSGAALSGYLFVDALPGAGTFYYRIKAANRLGTVVYSEAIPVTLYKGGRGVHIYPNPVTGNRLQLRLQEMPAGPYTLQLCDAAGQKLQETRLQHYGGNASFRIPLGEGFKSGAYRLRTMCPDGSVLTGSILLLK